MTNPKEPFLHWPGIQGIRRRAALGLFFLSFFYLFYGGAAFTAELIPWRFNVGLEFEKSIPFIPDSALLYLSVSWMMLLALFVVKQWADLKALVRVLCLQTLFGAACFLIFPVANNFPPRPVAKDTSLLFLLADTINLANNEVPSLHVCFAITLAAVMGHYAEMRLRILLLVWALAIALSTLTMHEHNLVDLLAGGMLALWGVQRWRRSASGLHNRQSSAPLFVESVHLE